jgi:short-subunit dehydrogenase
MARQFGLALVTGASAGIGREFARRLAARGSNLVLVARDAGRLEQLAGELSSRYQVDVDVLATDLRTDEGMRSIERRLAEEPPVDLLVNNAGYAETGAFADLPVEAAQGQIALNVTALVTLAHAAAISMRKAGRGAIVNLASGAAFVPSPRTAVYSGTKAFVVTFSQALREELGPFGVGVTVVCPGFTRTEFQERANFDTSPYPDYVWQSAEEVVDESLAALDADRGLCIPGTPNRVLSAALQLIPRRALGPVVGALVRRIDPNADTRPPAGQGARE